MKYRALAWDDLPEEYLSGLIDRLSKNRNITVKVTEESDDFMRRFEQDGPWDFLILDVVDDADPEDPDARAGIRLADLVRAKNATIPIVFLTHDEDRILRDDITASEPILKKFKSPYLGPVVNDIVEFVRGNHFDYKKVYLICNTRSYGDVIQRRITEKLVDLIESRLRYVGLDTLISPKAKVQNARLDNLIKKMNPCGTFVALCTPDDKVFPDENSSQDEQYTYQPDSNVLFEMGIAAGLREGYQRMVILHNSDEDGSRQLQLPPYTGEIAKVSYAREDEIEAALDELVEALVSKGARLNEDDDQ